MSVFAGRIADTGVDPSPMMKESLEIVRALPKAELLWASVREVLNVFQAAACGCHIVTVPHNILKKLLELEGKDLDELSLDTVRMFHRDAVAAGLELLMEAETPKKPARVRALGGDCHLAVGGARVLFFDKSRRCTIWIIPSRSLRHSCAAISAFTRSRPSGSTR